VPSRCARRSSRRARCHADARAPVLLGNHRPKSDADIMRDAKREAMGMPPTDEDTLLRRPAHQNQMATDDIVRSSALRISGAHASVAQVMERFKKRMRK
jgi:hypothetical protein